MAVTQQNIILLTIDCLRYDRCGFTGYERNTTPFLDEIASEGYIFEQAIAPGTWTSESFPGILAGRHSPDVAYHDKLSYKALPQGSETLATQMNAAGFETVATVTNTQLTQTRNFDIGFDDFSNLDTAELETDSSDDQRENGGFVNSLKEFAKERIGVNKVMYELNRRDSLWTPYTLPAMANQLSGHFSSWPYTRAEDVLPQFRDDITQYDADTPVFGWTHLMDLHAPLHPQSVRAGGLCDASRTKCLLADVNRIANNDAPVYDDMYDSTLRYVDKQIKNFVEALKKEGIWSNTTLIVTSDHGESLGDRGVYGHWNHYPYDDLIRVPLIVRPAGGTNQTTIDHVFSLSWLHELLAELTDTEPADMPTQSGVKRHLEGGSKETLAVTDSLREWSHLVVVRSTDWKLVRNYYPEGPRNESERYGMLKHLGATDDEDVMQLMDSLNFSIDLANDPAEVEPIDVTAAPAEMQKRSEEIKTDPETVREVSGQMSNEMKERLKDLGYI